MWVPIDDICVCTRRSLPTSKTVTGDIHRCTVNYCSPSCQCGRDEGDCDRNEDCQAGLSCIRNVGADYGWDPGRGCVWDSP